MQIPLPKEAILVRYDPRVWACPLNLFEYETFQTPNLVKLLLGNWNIRTYEWPVKFTASVNPDNPAIPILFMTETSPPWYYDFTLSLIDYKTYERLELR